MITHVGFFQSLYKMKDMHLLSICHVILVFENYLIFSKYFRPSTSTSIFETSSTNKYILLKYKVHWLVDSKHPSHGYIYKLLFLITCQFGAFPFGARQFDACQFGAFHFDAFHFDAVPVRRVSLWRDASLARFTLARFPFLFLC